MTMTRHVRIIRDDVLWPTCELGKRGQTRRYAGPHYTETSDRAAIDRKVIMVIRCDNPQCVRHGCYNNLDAARSDGWTKIRPTTKRESNANKGLGFTHYGICHYCDDEGTVDRHDQ